MNKPVVSGTDARDRVLAALRAGATTLAAVVAHAALSETFAEVCLSGLAAEGWIWSEQEPYRLVAPAYRTYAVRRRARAVLARAVAAGEMQPAAQCARCRIPGEESKLYGLQPDPQRPLRVEAWLCATCYQVAQRRPSSPGRLRRRRGRPGVAEAGVKVSVKIPAPVYDAYCRRAIAAGVSVHALLRRTLSVHARSTKKTGPISGASRSE